MNRVELILGMLVLSFAWVVLIEGLGAGMAAFIRDWLFALLQLVLTGVVVQTLLGLLGGREGDLTRRSGA